MQIAKTSISFCLVTLALLSGCSHARLAKQLEEKLAVEPEVKNTGSLRSEAAKVVESATGLNEQQKTQIRTLWSTTRERLDKMTQTSLKLRALLIEDLASTEPEEREIDLIKKRLSDVEHDRLSLYFSSVRQTNQLLGRWGSSEERYRFFEDMDFADHMR